MSDMMDGVWDKWEVLVVYSWKEADLTHCGGNSFS